MSFKVPCLFRSEPVSVCVRKDIVALYPVSSESCRAIKEPSLPHSSLDEQFMKIFTGFRDKVKVVEPIDELTTCHVTCGVGILTCG